VLYVARVTAIGGSERFSATIQPRRVHALRHKGVRRHARRRTNVEDLLAKYLTPKKNDKPSSSTKIGLGVNIVDARRDNRRRAGRLDLGKSRSCR